MPSTFLAQDKPSHDLKPVEGVKKITFVELTSGKLSSMKSFGEKIKAETKKLVSYPGKALKRINIDENDEENERPDEDFAYFFKEHDILMEFKYVCKNPPSGVYVIPSIKSLQVWHGIIFLRAGPFKEGVFRFDILLPDNFPRSAPLVRFTSNIFHPQIHRNGILNLEQAFPLWKKGENHMSDVLKYVKSCFYNLNTSGALNEKAAMRFFFTMSIDGKFLVSKLYILKPNLHNINDNLDEFKAKAQECVEQSLRQFEEGSIVTSEDDGNLLKIGTFTETLVNEWKEKLLYKNSPSHELNQLNDVDARKSW